MTFESDKEASFAAALNRRHILGLGAAGFTTLLLPGLSHADEADVARIKKDLFGDRPINEGRVTVTLPPIAENGNSVPFEVDVESPMTTDDYVKQILVLSPRNPEALISRFEFSPKAGKAHVATRIRMAGSQGIEAVAEMSDGSLWTGSKQTIVTLAACVIG